MENLKEFLVEHKFKIIIFVILLLLLGGTSLYLYYNYKDNRLESDRIVGVTPIATADDKIETIKEVSNVIQYTVDIKGQVKNPGVYVLKEGSRVSDAIEMAGGLTNLADTSVIALSKKVKDEMVIIIYSKDEVKNFTKIMEEETKKIEECKCQNNINNDACVNNNNSTKDETPTITGKVSINSGTLQQLMTLPGVGESKANAIIKYRQDNGLFSKIEDLKNVSGIGESTFNALKDLIEI